MDRQPRSQRGGSAEYTQEAEPSGRRTHAARNSARRAPPHNPPPTHPSPPIVPPQQNQPFPNLFGSNMFGHFGENYPGGDPFNFFSPGPMPLWIATAQQLMEEAQGEAESSRRSITRDHVAVDNRVGESYFDDDATYPEHLFKRRYRMRRSLFNRIVSDLETNFTEFKWREDAAHRLGHSPRVKVTVALRMLAYNICADALDDQYHIGETTALKTVRDFCRCIRTLYEETYLRQPTTEDLRRLQRVAKQRGFPGMLGSLDCMHWTWRSCPTAHQAVFRGYKGTPTLILEAVASHDLWIWHANFGTPGSRNDLNVLYQSNLFDSMLQGTTPSVRFKVNNRWYEEGYYLVDGIYPPWATFVKQIDSPVDDKEQFFNERQSALRKDVERAFGVLQAQFHIVQGSVRFWDESTLRDVMATCIILHNMIIEDERDEHPETWQDDPGNYEITSPSVELNQTPFSRYYNKRDYVRNRHVHGSLRDDLVQHVWSHRMSARGS